MTALQSHKYTSYERNIDGNDYAMARQYHGFWSRFDQPDPFDGSYDLTNPQSLNRYSYVQNDPVNFVDPSGLEMSLCYIDGVQSDCGTAFGLIGSGAGVFGPASTTRWNPSANNGQGGFEFFRAYASGNSGWYDMQGYSVTVTANLHLDGYGSWFAGSAAYYSFGPIAFGGMSTQTILGYQPNDLSFLVSRSSGRTVTSNTPSATQPPSGYLDISVSFGLPNIPFRLFGTMTKFPLGRVGIPNPVIGVRVNKGLYPYIGWNEISSHGFSFSAYPHTGTFNTGWDHTRSVSGGNIVGGTVSSDGSWGAGFTTPGYSAFPHVYVGGPYLPSK